MSDTDSDSNDTIRRAFGIRKKQVTTIHGRGSSQHIPHIHKSALKVAERYFSDSSDDDYEPQLDSDAENALDGYVNTIGHMIGVGFEENKEESEKASEENKEESEKASDEKEKKEHHKHSDATANAFSAQPVSTGAASSSSHADVENILADVPGASSKLSLAEQKDEESDEWQQTLKDRGYAQKKKKIDEFSKKRMDKIKSKILTTMEMKNKSLSDVKTELETMVGHDFGKLSKMTEPAQEIIFPVLLKSIKKINTLTHYTDGNVKMFDNLSSSEKAIVRSKYQIMQQGIKAAIQQAKALSPADAGGVISTTEALRLLRKLTRST